MSRNCDLSQISDIQNISRISRSNCGQIMGGVDSLQYLFEQQCSLMSNTSRNITNQRTNHLEKTMRHLTLCEESIGEHLKSKMILECIKEATINEKGILSDEIVNKLKGLLSIQEINKYIHLPSALQNVQEKFSVLGITDLPKYNFTCQEVLDIKCYVETLLRDKIYKFVLRYEQLGGNIQEISRSNDSNMHKKLFESRTMQTFQGKDKIEELCVQYEADIVKYKTLIGKWNKLKYEDLKQIYSEKAEHLLLQAQVAEIQAKITKLSCIMKMYKETPITIDAYRMLESAVDTKLFNIMKEIEEKKNLKKQYEHILLQNTEYDEVLKKYLHLSKAIKTKSQILENL